MADEINLRVRDELSARFAAALRAADAELLDVSTALVSALLDRAHTLASGELLAVHTGAFLDSLSASVRLSGSRVVSTLSSDLEQSAILEFGGRIPAHDILPDVAKALRFAGGFGGTGGGMGGDVGDVYAAAVHDPGATIGKHPVLETALADMRGTILDRMNRVAAALVDGL